MTTFAFSVQEEDDYWVIPIDGWEVSQCIIGTSLWLVFFESLPEIHICLENPFSLLLDGQERHFNPAEPLTLGPVLALVHAQVVSAKASKMGALELVFAHNIVLRVPPHPRNQAWELSVVDGMNMVCAPGGRIYIFP